MNVLNVSSQKPERNSKFSDGQLVEIHSQGLSIPKLAKQLGVAQSSVCARMKKLGLKANYKRAGVSRYEKVGSKHFRCASCKGVKLLQQRAGRACHKCRNKRRVGTIEGALHFRYTMKKSVARRKGIPFNLTFEYFKGLYEEQDGKDGYTGEQLCFEFGQGRSGATASLDRIDNDGGYTNGNVKFCRLATNSKKGKKSVDQFMVQMELDFTSGVSDVSQPESEEVSNT